MSEKPQILRIPSLPGYWASRDGRIFSSKKKMGPSRRAIDVGEPMREISPQSSAGRPTFVFLFHEGRNRKFSVGPLVLEAFVCARPFPSAVCRHFDDDGSDNRVENLSWGSASENRADARRNRRVGKAALLFLKNRHPSVYAEFVEEMRAGDYDRPTAPPRQRTTET